MLLLLLLQVPKFESQTIDPAIQIGYGLAVGDVDGDGKPDVLLADAKQIVWYRNGDWKKSVIAENLTEKDNVCIAARDIDGDGKVEVAVGAMWNPGETSDPAKSGSLHYLVRPADPTQRWEAIRFGPHEPTVHRMRWVRVAEGKFQLVVVPLHGRGNKNGQGTPVKVLAYERPADPKGAWTATKVDESLHITHNFDVISSARSERLIIVGREGVVSARFNAQSWASEVVSAFKTETGGGEIRVGHLKPGMEVVATVEPWHGHQAVAYCSGPPGEARRVVLDDTFKEAHAIGVGDFLGLGRDQIAVGWRNPDKNRKVGIKLFVPDDATGAKWTPHVVDDNTMATEDLQVADLNADGKPDIVAAGRATKNVIVYWNRR